MKRRNFIRSAGALAALPLFFKGQALQAFGGNLFLDVLAGLRPDRKLVLVQLNGGNDGLNTLVPLDQYANLQKARPNIIIPESKLLSLENSLGLHPSLEKSNDFFLCYKSCCLCCRIA